MTRSRTVKRSSSGTVKRSSSRTVKRSVAATVKRSSSGTVKRSVAATAAISVVEAAVWAGRQFGDAVLGDERRTRRACRVAAGMVRQPGASIPAMCGSEKAAKAAYRMFAEDDVTLEGLQEPHWRQVRQQAAEVPRVLFIQDGTLLDYSSHAATGLAPIGNGRGRGMNLHSVLAVVPPSGEDGVGRVLGLAWQRCWTTNPRGPLVGAPDADGSDTGDLWPDAVRIVGAPPGPSDAPAEHRWIHVADRESDNFLFFDACRGTGVGFVSRLYQPRKAVRGHDVPLSSVPAQATSDLLTLARSLPSTGQTRLFTRSRPTRAPGWRTLQVAWCPVTVPPPRTATSSPPLRCWAIRVWEDNPKEKDAIEWILLTSEPVTTHEAAMEIAGWYGQRWTIEEYHKCLKTGCRVEERQLEHVERLAPLIGMLAVTAVRLLQLKFESRIHPDAPARDHVPPEMVEMLVLYREAQSREPLREQTARPSRRPPLRAETMTLRQFWHGVAGLGGFLGRRRDGDPGWQTLWRGWQILDQLLTGARLERARQKCG